MLEKYIKQLNNDGELYLNIKVKPGYNKTEIKDYFDDGLLINIGAKPEQGKAKC